MDARAFAAVGRRRDAAADEPNPTGAARALQSELRRIVPLALLVACPALVLAQQADGEIEQIIVTGSRIARPDFESASPIISITADAFARTGSTSVDAVVSRLPQFTPDFTSTSNNPGNGGQGNVQLRGLGATSTLVLLDGLTLRAGIENIADEDPPIFPSWIAANTEPSQYDLLGRRFYVNLSYRF
jgi:outer membrane receptor for ferrienterochelin and colicin